MSYGLRVWDASGVLQIDVTNRITRIFGVYSFSVAAGSSTNVSVPGITTDGTWVAYAPFTQCQIFSGYVAVHNRGAAALSGSLLVLRL